ncbi:MAG: class I SAM-dependent methyltransferase [archaeon]|nr:class I SAM-dependent methyltransferase [archaeon]
MMVMVMVMVVVTKPWWELPGVTRASLLTLGTRMRDAASKEPICNDTLATTLVASLPLSLRFLAHVGALLGTDDPVVRHRILDDLLLRRLRLSTASPSPATLVLSLGAGWETRPCRFPPVLLEDCRWVEVDALPLIRLKERVLSCFDHPHSQCLCPSSSIVCFSLSFLLLNLFSLSLC